MTGTIQRNLHLRKPRPRRPQAHKLLSALSELLDLEIVYQRKGNRRFFSFTRSNGEKMALEIEAGKVAPSDSQVVH